MNSEVKLCLWAFLIGLILGGLIGWVTNDGPSRDAPMQLLEMLGEN